MRLRYYVKLADGQWSEASYNCYKKWRRAKTASPRNILSQLNSTI